MSIETIIVAAISGGLLTMIGKWIFGRRKQKVDTLQAEVTAMQGIIETWKSLAEGLRTEVDNLEELVKQYREENRLLKKQVDNLIEQVKRMKK